MSAEDHSKLQLELHISEYQAVTNKATYYALLSSAVWPAIGLYLTVIAALWNQIVARKYGPPSVVWVSGVVVQGALMAWAGMTSEQYAMVLYVERHLRPLVKEVVQTPLFWLYEPFNSARRARTGTYLWWEMSVPCTMAVALLVAASYRALHLRERTYLLDVGGFLTNLAMLLVLFRTCWSVVETRRAWETSEHHLEEIVSESQARKADR